MKPRRILFWLHLCAGVFAGTIILIMSVTGVLLAYERQIVDYSLRSYRSAPPFPDAHRLSARVLLAAARESQPGMNPSNMMIHSDPQEPVAVRFGRDVTVYLNPYSGDVLGTGPRKLQAFFQSVEYWHRWLGVSDANRATARMLTGYSNLLFLVLISTGPFLWWPKAWTPALLRNITFFRKGLSGKAREYNWHNTIGVWCAIPLFIIILCSVFMSLPWANDLLYRMAGSPVPPRAAAQAPNARAARTERGEGRRNATYAASQENFDALWARAEHQVPDWRSITLRVPGPSEVAAAFTIDQGNGGRPDKRAMLTLDAKTAEIVKWEPFSSSSTGRRLRTWARFTHTGEAGGIPGETLAVIVTLGAAFLAWTGLAMAARRFFAWVTPKSRTSPPTRPENIVRELRSGDQTFVA